MLGLVMVVESFTARHRLDFTDTASLSWAMSGEAAGAGAKGSDVLCAGDSLAKHGLLPRVIEDRSGVAPSTWLRPALRPRRPISS